MATLTQGKWTGEFLLSDEGTYSRDQVTIAAASPAMVPGTVMGKITASGKWAPYNNANADGTQTAAGILLYAVPDSASDQKAVVITRLAEVAQTELTGYDAPAGVELTAIGIIVR